MQRSDCDALPSMEHFTAVPFPWDIRTLYFLIAQRRILKARIVMRQQTALISAILYGFREVTRFAKMNSFHSSDPLGNVGQRRIEVGALLERPHDLESNFVQVMSYQPQSF